MEDNRPIFEMRGVRLLNVPNARDLAVECIENDCYRIRELEGQWNVIDVGACYGEFGLYAASLGHNAILAEPSRNSLAITRFNATINHPFRSRVKTYHCAVAGSENPQCNHFYRKSHPAGSGPNCEDGEMEKVVTRSILGLADGDLDKSLKTMLKLDCEGAEVEIFNHINKWIHLADAVSMETHNHDAGKLGAMLSERGFKVELFGTCPFPFPKWDESMAGGLVIARR